jgi:hypothetical protein
MRGTRLVLQRQVYHGKQVFEQRLKITSEIVRLLVTMIPQQRGYLVREDVPVQEIE